MITESMTLIHVGSALVAMLAAATAVGFRKGSTRHVQPGYVFVATMIIMAIPGGIMSYQIGRPFDVF